MTSRDSRDWPIRDESTLEAATRATSRPVEGLRVPSGPSASDQTAATPSRRYHDWYGGERRQSWATPSAFFAPLHEEFSFTLDGASEPGNGLLSRASTAETPLSWHGERVFCNPPWSNIRPFVELAATAELAVLLVPARTCARWFHRALDLGATVRYFKPKPKFVGAKHVSPVDCVLLVFDNAEAVAA